MLAHIHYEAAFENHLRQEQIPYVAVDEANWPARQLYERWGFKVADTQVGMFCDL